MPPKKSDMAHVVVVYHNIKLSVGHLGEFEQALIPREEAEAIAELDRKAGRKARIVIVEPLQ